MRRHARRTNQPGVEVPALFGIDDVDVSLLDVIDHVLNQGIVLSGDLTLGVADVDLISVRLLALICTADRVSGPPPADPRPRARKGRPSGRE